ncbi:MAG: GTP-binding protein [Clostridia bacterium]|nr:GTP-binding protein [Clostridia bacterium]
MTKIDIFSGFLGAGKTTLIKKLISEAYNGEKLVLIENEFGEIGVDAGFLEDAGINITEMNSGCICCSLVGDFGEALKKVIAEYSPDRILIEPSGVGKLSDVMTAVKNSAEGAELSAAVAVVDAKKCRMYMKNFGEFFNNQIENASTIVLSHTSGLSNEKLNRAIEMIREHNHTARLVTAEWDDISGADILAVIDGSNSLAAELHKMEEEAACPVCHGHHHHEHHHHDEECDCHEHHHHDEECDCHEHHHHDEECDCHEHHHHDEDCDCHEHHHHDEECSCGCGGHHHHHHADEVFSSWGIDGTRKYTKEELEAALREIENEEKYGMVLRAKGIVPADCGWLHFDYTPGEADVRLGAAAAAGRLCVIGSKINEEALAELFK